MKNEHGGIHEWDLTAQEVHQALFVGSTPPSSHSSPSSRATVRRDTGGNTVTDPSEVDQCNLDRVRPCDPMHKADDTATVPPSLSAAQRRSFRLGDPRFHGYPTSLLRLDHDCQDMGVHPQNKNLGQVNSRTLRQRFELVQRERPVQYDY